MCKWVALKTKNRILILQCVFNILSMLFVCLSKFKLKKPLDLENPAENPPHFHQIKNLSPVDNDILERSGSISCDTHFTHAYSLLSLQLARRKLFLSLWSY